MQLSTAEQDDFYDIDFWDEATLRDADETLKKHLLETYKCFMLGLCLQCKIELNDDTHSTSCLEQICDCCCYEMSKEY